MTLGTNATIRERLEYAPHELNHQEIIEALDELELWRELCEDCEYGPEDVKARIDELENDYELRANTIEELEERIADLEGEVDDLGPENSHLEDHLKELQGKQAP